MRSAWPSLLVGCCLATQTGHAQDSLPEALRQARALIAASKTEDAVHLAEQYTSAHPRDPRGFLGLGDAYFQRMPAGRFLAVRSYREAERLAPRDPEAPYKVAQAGLWLGGDDGEAMAQQGLERVLELDPLYGEAWDQWLTLFRNAGFRRRIRERLAPHADNPLIRSRLALLAIEEEQYTAADSLLDSALAADSANPAWLALRAQSAFEAGDTLRGWTFYRRALAHADRDSTDALWHQAVGIASPGEIRAWTAGVRADQKGDWLASLWARRNPNLFAGLNHRLAEHFARLRYARKNYPLLHPLISYHRSQIARAMNLEPSVGEREYNQRCEMYQVMLPPRLHIPFRGALGESNKDDPEAAARAAGVSMPGVSRARDRARVNLDPFARVTREELAAAPREVRRMVPPGVEQSLFAPLNLSLKSMDSVAARIGYNLATGLDDRGVMYLRFGPPDKWFVGGKNDADPQCSVPDVERWQYEEYGEVRFARPSAFSRGERNVPDMVFRAMNERQFAAVQTGLTRDASSEPAPLDFGIWTAQFADPADTKLTDLVVVSTRGAVAASLEGMAGAGDIWIDHAGAVTVRSDPGRYVLMAQAADSGQLGRQTLQIAVRRFDQPPAVSEMLLALAWVERNLDRATMLQHVQRTLVFAQGSTIRSYAEVYGLRPDAGTVRYRARYELLRTDAPERDIRLEDWPMATRIEFRRERPAAAEGAEVETLDIVPAQVPPGKYLLRVRIEDLLAGRDAGRGSIAFVVR